MKNFSSSSSSISVMITMIIIISSLLSIVLITNSPSPSIFVDAALSLTPVTGSPFTLSQSTAGTLQCRQAYDGNYICANSALNAVVKYSISPLAIVDVSASAGNYMQSCDLFESGTPSTYRVICAKGYSSPVSLWAVRAYLESDLSLAASGTDAVTDSPYPKIIVDTANGRAYVSLFKWAGATIYKFKNLDSTPAKETTLTPIGIQSSALILGPSGVYCYCASHDSATDKLIVSRITTGGLTVTSITVPFAQGISSHDMQVDSNYLYVPTQDGYISRWTYDAAFAYVDTLRTNPYSGSNPTSSCMSADKAYIFITLLGNNQIVVVNVASFSMVAGVSASVPNAFGSPIATTAKQLFAFSSTASTVYQFSFAEVYDSSTSTTSTLRVRHLSSVSPATFTPTGTQTGIPSMRECKTDRSNTWAFCTTEGDGVLKFTLSPFAYVGATPYTAAVEVGIDIYNDEGSNHRIVTATGWNFGPPVYGLRVYKMSDLSSISTVLISGPTTDFNRVAVDSFTKIAYMTSGDTATPNIFRIINIDATPSHSGTVTSGGSGDYVPHFCIIVGGYFYAFLTNSPFRITQVRLSTFTWVATSTPTAGDTSWGNNMAADETYIYVAGLTRIVRFIHGYGIFARLDVLPLSTQFVGILYVSVPPGGFLFAGARDSAVTTQAVIFALNLTSFTVVSGATISLKSTGFAPFPITPSSSSTKKIFAFGNTYNTVFQYTYDSIVEGVVPKLRSYHSQSPISTTSGAFGSWSCRKSNDEAFAACAAVPGDFPVVYNLQPFSVKAVAMTPGGLVRSCDIFDTGVIGTSKVLCTRGVTSAALLFYAASTLTAPDALTLAIGTTPCVAVDSTNFFAFVSEDDGGGSKVFKITNINTATPVNSGNVALSNKPQSILFIPSAPTYIYVYLSSSAAISRVSTAGLVFDSTAVTLFGEGSSVAPLVADTTNNYIYMLTTTGTIVRFTYGSTSFVRVDSLITGVPATHSFSVSTTNTLMFLASVDNHQIVMVNLTSFAVTGEPVYTPQARGAPIAMSDKTLYSFGWYTDQVWKYSFADDNTEVPWLRLDKKSPLNYGQLLKGARYCRTDAANTFAICVIASSNVVRFDVDPFAFAYKTALNYITYCDIYDTGSIATSRAVCLGPDLLEIFTASSLSSVVQLTGFIVAAAASIVVDAPNKVAYAGDYKSLAGKIFKFVNIDTASPTLATTLTVPGATYLNAIALVKGNLYIHHVTSPVLMSKINLPDFTYNSTISFEPGTQSNPLALLYDDDFIYDSCSSYLVRVIYSPAFQQFDSIWLGGTSNSGAWSVDRSLIYFTCITFNRFYAVNVSSMKVVGRNFTVQSVFGQPIVSKSGNIYVFNGLNENIVVLGNDTSFTKTVSVKKNVMDLRPHPNNPILQPAGATGTFKCTTTALETHAVCTTDTLRIIKYQLSPFVALAFTAALNYRSTCDLYEPTPGVQSTARIVCSIGSVGGVRSYALDTLSLATSIATPTLTVITCIVVRTSDATAYLTDGTRYTYMITGIAIDSLSALIMTSAAGTNPSAIILMGSFAFVHLQLTPGQMSRIRISNTIDNIKVNLLYGSSTYQSWAGLAVDPDNNLVFDLVKDGTIVRLLATETVFQMLDAIITGFGDGTGLTMVPGNIFLVGTSKSANQIWIFDTSSKKIIANATMPSPSGAPIVLSSKIIYAFTTNANDVYMFNFDESNTPSITAAISESVTVSADDSTSSSNSLPSPTAEHSATISITAEESVSVSESQSVSDSLTFTNTTTETVSATASLTATDSASISVTVSETASGSETASATDSPSSSPTPAESASLTITTDESASISETRSTSGTDSTSPSIVHSASISFTAAETASASRSQSTTESVSKSPTAAETASISITAADSTSDSQTPSITDSSSRSVTDTMTETDSDSSTPSIVDSSTASITAVDSSSVSESITDSRTSSISVTFTETESPTASRSSTPTSTNSSTQSITVTDSTSISESQSFTDSRSTSMTVTTTASLTASHSSTDSVTSTLSATNSATASITDSSSASISATASITSTATRSASETATTELSNTSSPTFSTTTSESRSDARTDTLYRVKTSSNSITLSETTMSLSVSASRSVPPPITTTTAASTTSVRLPPPASTTTTTTASPAPGEILAVTDTYEPPSNPSSTSLINIEDLVGNNFYAPGLSPSCGGPSNFINTTFTSKCVDQFHACHLNRRLNLSAGACPTEYTTCSESYVTCMFNLAQNELSVAALGNSTRCVWTPSFLSYASLVATTSGSSEACEQFAKTFAVGYYNCTADYTALCKSFAVKIFIPSLGENVDLSGRNSNLPAGVPAVVVYTPPCGTLSSEYCKREYPTGGCACPTGAGWTTNTLQLFAPSYLVSRLNDTCGRGKSNYDFCYREGGTSALENVSFSLKSGSAVSYSYNNRIGDPYTVSGSCDGDSSKTLRVITLLAPSSATTPTTTNNAAVGRQLQVCAPTSTNIFVLSSVYKGGCVNPRASQNISCTCDGARTIGLNVIYINTSTQIAEPGVLVVCTYEIPKTGAIPTGVVATGVTVTVTSGFVGGTSAGSLQMATLILLACRDATDANNGKSVLIPFTIGDDDETKYILFSLVMMVGFFFFHLFCVLLYAAVQYSQVGGEDYFELPPIDWNGKQREKDDRSGSDNDGDDDDKDKDEDVMKAIESKSMKMDDIDDMNAEIERMKKAEAAELSRRPERRQEKQEQQNEIDPTSIVPVSPVKEKRSNEEDSSTTENEQNHDQSPTTSSSSPTKMQIFYFRFVMACARLRFPGFTLNIPLRILYQGTTYEALYMLFHYQITGEIAALAVVALIFCICSLVFIFFIAQQLRYGQTLLNVRKYRYTYREYFTSRTWRFLIAPDSYWSMESLFSQRFNSIFNMFSGRTSKLHWMVPSIHAKSLIASVIAAISADDAVTCNILMGLLLALNFVFAVAQLYWNPYRFAVDLFSQGVLTVAIIILMILIMARVDTDSVVIVYIIIVVISMVATVVMGSLVMYEFFFGKPRELQKIYEQEEEEEEENNNNDNRNNNDEDQNMPRQQQGDSDVQQQQQQESDIFEDEVEHGENLERHNNVPRRNAIDLTELEKFNNEAPSAISAADVSALAVRLASVNALRAEINKRLNNWKRIFMENNGHAPGSEDLENNSEAMKLFTDYQNIKKEAEMLKQQQQQQQMELDALEKIENSGVIVVTDHAQVHHNNHNPFASRHNSHHKMRKNSIEENENNVDAAISPLVHHPSWTKSNNDNVVKDEMKNNNNSNNTVNLATRNPLLYDHTLEGAETYYDHEENDDNTTDDSSENDGEEDQDENNSSGFILTAEQQQESKFRNLEQFTFGEQFTPSPQRGDRHFNNNNNGNDDDNFSNQQQRSSGAFIPGSTTARRASRRYKGDKIKFNKNKNTYDDHQDTDNDDAQQHSPTSPSLSRQTSHLQQIHNNKNNNRRNRHNHHQQQNAQQQQGGFMQGVLDFLGA